MARAEKGTVRKLRIWLERQRTEATDEIVLCSLVGGDANVISSWPVKDALTGSDWDEHVFDLAQSNANERGSTTLYSIRLMRNDKCRSVYEIKCRADGERDATEFDGSSASLVQGLYHQNDQLLRHILASQNVAVGPLTKALEAANERVRSLESERERLTDENYRMRAKVNELEAKLATVDEEQMDKVEERLGKLFLMAKAHGFLPGDS
jgi:hypothetical protein